MLSINSRHVLYIMTSNNLSLHTYITLSCINITSMYLCVKVVPINIKILTNSNQQTQSYKFTSHIAAFLTVVLITEMLEICIQTSYDQNVQLILKSYLPVVYGTPLRVSILLLFLYFLTGFRNCSDSVVFSVFLFIAITICTLPTLYLCHKPFGGPNTTLPCMTRALYILIKKASFSSLLAVVTCTLCSSFVFVLYTSKSLDVEIPL